MRLIRVFPRKTKATLGTLIRYVPCPDCGGTTVIHCCDGDRACPEADSSDGNGSEG